MYPDELRADFQQYYGLNIDGMGEEYSYAHAAALLVQLPRSSRVSCAISPENEWDDAAYLLNIIEYDLRVLIWQNSKDGQKGRNKPKPGETPLDRSKKRKRVEGFDKDFTDRILGKEVGDGS